MRAAAVQLNSSEDRDANLAAAEGLVRAAAADGARLVVLPEKFNRLGRPKVLLAEAEALDGPSLTWARALARELGIDLVAGSIVERVEGSERGRNTCAHVGPDGEIRALYRKIHMFDVEIGGRVYRESHHEEAGEEIVLSILEDGVELGLSVCYDLRFPELYRVLAGRGARVLTVPSAFTLTTTRDHWEVLLRARAIEDQCFVVAANQVGEHPGGLRSGGRSLIADPWGVVLAQAPDAPGYVVAELDLERLDDVRARLPSLASRREDVYAGTPELAAEAQELAARPPEVRV
jgi:predicted amidohydrolase